RHWYLFRRHRQDTLSMDHAIGEDEDSTFGDLIVGRDQSPADTVALDEFILMVEECMQKLEYDHRRIMAMRNVLDLSYESIAHILGISEGTVKSRLSRARENLRMLLERNYSISATGDDDLKRFLSVRSAADARIRVA
ncbi:sigma-70 family RNA polymerase sigma factor, partial [Candidatus Parcubacteria bacterium]|nr:sigma-70 family RNA polymerase sigma factor [Candidatus Parcubacteria bacterium]